jgi:hypothetical protein
MKIDIKALKEATKSLRIAATTNFMKFVFLVFNAISIGILYYALTKL